MLKLLFLLTTAAAFFLFYLGTGKKIKPLSGTLAWQGLVCLLSVSGWFQAHPTFFPLVMLVTVIVTVVTWKNLRNSPLSPVFLLAVHLSRIAVEGILYQMYLDRKIPVEMTFAGWNFDIAIGITALFWLIAGSPGNYPFPWRRFFYAWNIIGLAFLLFIVSLAILSSPLPIQQMGFDQPNIAVLAFPYMLLPSGIVPLVLLSHLLLLKSYNFRFSK